MNSNGFDFQNLEFAYVDSPVILRINGLKIEEGERVLVTGASGSGKTTWFRITTGLFPGIYRGFLTGKANYTDRPISEYKANDLFSDLAVIPQDSHAVVGSQYVLSELATKLENEGMPPEDIIAWISRIDPSLFDVSELKFTDPRRLSVGEMQALNLVRATATGFRWLIMDEPFTGLDFRTANSARECVQRILKETRGGLIVFSHDFKGFSNMVQRVVVLEKGNVKYDGPTDQLPNDMRDSLWSPHPTLCKFLNEQSSSSESQTMNEVRFATNMNLTNFNAIFEERTVMSDVNVDAEFVPLLLQGPTGCGKSTILNRIAALRCKDSGQLSLEKATGETILLDDVGEREFGKFVSISPQNPRWALLGRTVWEELTMRRHVSDCKQAWNDEADSVLKSLQLDHLKARDPRTLSSGELKRLSVATALLSATDWALFDEPTANLDRENRDRIIDVLLRFLEQGRAMAVASHDPNVIVALGSRIFNPATGLSSNLADLRSKDKEFVRSVRHHLSISHPNPTIRKEELRE